MRRQFSLLDYSLLFSVGITIGLGVKIYTVYDTLELSPLLSLCFAFIFTCFWVAYLCAVRADEKRLSNMKELLYGDDDSTPVESLKTKQTRNHADTQN